jgi:hypothetical protein
LKLKTLAVTCFIFVCAGSPAFGETVPTDITWFQGGQDLLSLTEIGRETDYAMTLRGKTPHRSLMLMVARKGRKDTNRQIPLNSSGEFAVTYLFNEGPGAYTVTIFTAAEAPPQQYNSVARFSLNVTGKVPANLPGKALDRRILDYVEKVKGSQVGRGECWDLAQEALDENGADWTRNLNYGPKINPRDAKPGDIVQFREVKLTEKLPNGGSRWEVLGMPDHTAIVYEVISPLHLRLAHQNIGGNRTVQITDVNLNNRTAGKFTIHRPRVGLLLEK